MATLVDAAQRLLLQRGDAAGLVARRGVALADIFADSVEVRLKAAGDLIDAIVDFLVDSTAGQNVLSANEFGGLGENAGTACLHHQIAHSADGGVGSKAAGRIGAAAFRADNQFGQGELLLLEHGGFSHHLLGITNGDLNSLEGSAHFLNDDLLEGLVGALLNGLDHQVHLAVFAAQRHHHSTVDIGIGGIAGHYIHSELLVRGHLRAALLVIEADSALDLLCNDAGRVCGANAGGQDQYSVTHANPSVRTAISVKSHILYPPLLHPAAIFFHALNIVNMNMSALGDLFRGHTDVFAILHHRLTLFDGPGSQLMINGNIFRGFQRYSLSLFEIGNGIPCGNRLNGNGHIVFGVNNHCILHV